MILGRLGWTQIFNKELINATASVLSVALKTEYQSGYFSLYWQAVSAGGGVDLLFQLKVSISQTGTFVIPDGAADIVTNMTTEVARAISFQPIPTDWLKILVTGNAGNSADTLLDMWIYAN